MEGAENLEVEICGHEVLGQDHTSGDSHVFELKIWMSQNFYQIKRSYTNFLEFDYRLKKKYPKSSLPECPLASSSSSISILKHAAAVRKNSIVSKTIGHQENVGNKRGQLQKYLEDLLDIPEILRSIELSNFLDIESSNGDEISHETMSLIDTLLAKEKETTVTVLREYNLRLGVNETQYIIWKFTTKNKDIGFDILMETGGGIVLNSGTGTTSTVTTTSLLPYQRYKSHENAIEDVLEIQSTGFIILHWDNTYSKMLSKQLTFCFRVVDAEVYNATTQQCLEFSRNKLECESKRNTLRRILTSKCMSLLASSGIRASMSAASILDYKSGNSNISGSGNHILYEEMQNEIEQLKNEKNSLQIALSTAELTIANLKEKEEEYKEEITKRDEVLSQYQGGHTAVQRNGLVAELEAEKNRVRDLEEKLEELKVDNSKYRDVIEDYTRQTRRDSATQLTLHQQQTTLQNELRETQLELEGLKSTMAVTDSQLQRLKAEKKQLKTYAIQLKEKSETLEINSQLWEKNKATLTNLISEIRPLHLELSEQIEIISSLKMRYVQLLTSLGQPVSQAMVESTDSSLFTATNSMETASMLCDCAEMKGFVNSTNANGTQTGIIASSTSSALMQGMTSTHASSSPSPIKIQIKSDELQEIESTTSHPSSYHRDHSHEEQRDSRESEDSDDSPILKSVKSSLWEFGSTMLEVEESIDKLLR